MSQSKSKSKRAQARSRRSPWPLILVLGGLALVIAVVAGSLLSGTSQDDSSGPGTATLSIADIQSSPDAQVDGLKVDFGDMKLGAEMATVQVTLRNTGDKTLKFSQAPYVQLADGC